MATHKKSFDKEFVTLANLPKAHLNTIKMKLIAHNRKQKKTFQILCASMIVKFDCINREKMRNIQFQDEIIEVMNDEI